MVATSFNEAEDSALRRLPWRARIVYLQGIRRYMDYATGWSGKKRILSYQFFFELLECTDHTTAPDPSVSKDGLRAIFRMLERVGLVEWPRGTSTQRGVVFRCLLADTDHSVQKQDAPKTHPEDAPKTHPEDAPTKLSGNAASSEGDTPASTTETAPASTTEDAPPPVSGIKGIKEKPTTASPAAKASKKSSDYPLEFLAAMADYPVRSGGNPEGKAWKAWGARRKEGHSAAEMHAGVRRYAAWCERTGKIGTEYVKQAATFFGPDKHFLLAFMPPAIKSRAEDHLERVKRELRGEQGQIIEGRFSNG